MHEHVRRIVSAASMFLVAIALQRAATAPWGVASRAEGGVYRISPVGVSLAVSPQDPTAATIDCRWWPRAGDASLCAITTSEDAAHARLRLAYPSIQLALWLSVAALFLQVLRTPRQRWAHVLLAALVFACILAAIGIMRTMPERVLAILQGGRVSWTASGSLLAWGAALLSLTSMLLYPRSGTPRSGISPSGPPRGVLALALGASLFGVAVPLVAAQAPSKRAVPAIPADSTHGDARAFAALPARLREVLDVRRRIAVESADPNLSCVPLSATSDGSLRQRLQGKLGDGTSLVVFARFTPTGTLRRVEFVRRFASGEQRSFTWDAEGDATTASDWAAGSDRATSYPIPRGGPVPRSVRALGRLVTRWQCPPA